MASDLGETKPLKPYSTQGGDVEHGTFPSGAAAEPCTLHGSSVRRSQSGFTKLIEGDSSADAVHELLHDDTKDKYRVRKLATIGAMLDLTGTVLTEGLLWRAISTLVVVSLLSAAGCFFAISDPTGRSRDQFDNIVAAIKVFVAFLLTMFMANSLNRWQTIMVGFCGDMNNIRNLQLQLFAMEVEREKIDQVMKYAVTSTTMLITECQLSDTRWNQDEQDEWKQRMWDEVLAEGLMTEEEKEHCKSMVNADMLWLWIGMLLGRCISGPERVIVLNSVAATQGEIRKTKTNNNVQVPYIYVHMLSLLVHVNNLLCAGRFGLSIAVTLSDLLLEFDVVMPWHVKLPLDHSKIGAGSCVLQLLISLLSYMVAPIMYQGFLMIALALATPFSLTFHTTRIPVRQMLEKLKQDIKDATELSTNLPSTWAPREV